MTKQRRKLRKPNQIGRLIKRLRAKLGLTQTELARKSGVSQEYISQLEGGLDSMPRDQTLRKLGLAMDCRIDRELVCLPMTRPDKSRTIATA